MGIAAYSMGEDYWENFNLQTEDIEFLYNYLLETETPQTSLELAQALIKERIQRRKIEIEHQRMSGGELYLPKLAYKTGQKLTFPALDWKHGSVIGVRAGHNPDLGNFYIIQVDFDDDDTREFASEFASHKLNDSPKLVEDFDHLDEKTVLKMYSDQLLDALDDSLIGNSDFVRIAGRWFPRALLVDINVGHLNIAEAVLDMAGGGPLPTAVLLEQIELSSEVNPKLLEFSLDLSLQEDPRFDEVGPAGDTLWYLRRLEPVDVLNTPVYLNYQDIEFDRSTLTSAMLDVEQLLDDELTPSQGKFPRMDQVEVHLIYPHWRAGTLPLSTRTRHLFPTAYEAPRVRFMLVDGDTKETFPGWVVREKRYVHGLQEWYESHGVIPGSIIKIHKGEQPGQVIVQVDNRRPSRDWIRTLLVGSDGGTVFAMLKQTISTPVDERMAIAIPDKKALDPLWQTVPKDQQPFERLVVNTIRELARLNPQSHVHIAELYSAINVTRRCPPGPILELLASRPWFTHVGDLHFRLSDTDYD
jgi:hypothetical protein